MLGVTNKTITPDGSGADRFYVMSLSDLNVGGYSTYCWYNSASSTGMSDYATYASTTFGSGKKNTEDMITKWNASGYGATNNQDLWKHIQDVAGTGKRWFVPSKAEWSAFGGELGITQNNYSSKGLNSRYWSSSQNNTNNAWYANFNNGNMNNNNVNNNNYVHLSTSFIIINIRI